MTTFTINSTENNLELNNTRMYVQKESSENGEWIEVSDMEYFDNLGMIEQTALMSYINDELGVNMQDLMQQMDNAFPELGIDCIEDLTEDDGSQFYYSVLNESDFEEKLIEWCGTQNFSVSELYDKVKTNDLIISVEEMLVREKIQHGVSVHYEGYYHQGDASDEEIETLAKIYNTSVEEVFDVMDYEHGKAIEPTIIANEGSKEKAIQMLIKHGLHEGKI